MDDLEIETRWQEIQEHYELVKTNEELKLRAKRAYHRRFGTEAPITRVAVFDEDGLIDLDNGNEPVGQYRILANYGIVGTEYLSYYKIVDRLDGSVSFRRTTSPSDPIIR